MQGSPGCREIGEILASLNSWLMFFDQRNARSQDDVDAYLRATRGHVRELRARLAEFVEDADTRPMFEYMADRTQLLDFTFDAWLGA